MADHLVEAAAVRLGCRPVDQAPPGHENQGAADVSDVRDGLQGVVHHGLLAGVESLSWVGYRSLARPRPLVEPPMPQRPGPTRYLGVGQQDFDPLGGDKQVHLRHGLSLPIGGLWGAGWGMETPRDPDSDPPSSGSLGEAYPPAHLPASPGLHLDTVHSLLGLRHARAGGWVPLRHQLGGAQVLGPKYDTV